MAKSSTSFNKESQPNERKPRGKSERTKILESFGRLSKTENEFYDLLTVKAFDPEDNFSFKELLVRMSPVPKAVNPLYEFTFDIEGSPHKQALQIIDAISDGKLPSDVGNIIITSISSMLNIQEKTDFEERLKAIEDASEQD
jgi:hypothetical protein